MFLTKGTIDSFPFADDRFLPPICGSSVMDLQEVQTPPNPDRDLILDLLLKEVNHKVGSMWECFGQINIAIPQMERFHTVKYINKLGPISEFIYV